MPDQLYFIDITDVLYHFERVDAALQEAFSMFSSSNKEVDDIRKKRNVLGRSSRCTVSKDGLTELKNAIENALKDTSAHQSSNNCEMNPSSSSSSLDCDELLKLIRCGFNHLINGFKKATENRATLDEITKWKNAFDDLSEKSNKAIDDVKKSVSQEYKQELDQLKTKLQDLGVSLNKAIEQLKFEKQKLDVTAQKLCASEIHSGQIDSAINHFRELKDDSKLSKIIEIAYTDYGKLDNVENILKFINALPSAHQDVIAHESLFSQMVFYYHLDSPKVLMFDVAVRKTMSYSTVASKLVLLKNKLSTHVIKFIAALAKKRHFQEIKSYIRQSLITANTINDYFRCFIQTTYANSLANFQNTLEFIEYLSREFNELSYLQIGYETLFSVMKNNDHLDSEQLIMLAYKIKTSIHFTAFENLKNKFPTGIRVLLWNSWVEIESRLFPGQTIRSNYWGSLKVYSDNDDNQKWTVSITLENNNLYFKFTNQKYSYILGKFKDDTIKGCGRFWHDCTGSGGFWRVIPIENGAYFYISNKRDKTHLSAGSFGFNRDEWKIV